MEFAGEVYGFANRGGGDESDVDWARWWSNRIAEVSMHEAFGRGIVPADPDARTGREPPSLGANRGLIIDFVGHTSRWCQPGATA